MRIFRTPIYKMHLLLRSMSVLGANGVFANLGVGVNKLEAV